MEYKDGISNLDVGFKDCLKYFAVLGWLKFTYIHVRNLLIYT